MKKIIKLTLKILLVAFSSLTTLAIIVLIYFNWPISETGDDKVSLGVTFSKRYAEDIGLDWKETYLAVLDDLKARNIRLPVYWDWVEKEEGKFDFADVDWQLEEAKKRQVEIILAIGQKVPRWPECFIPDWTKDDDQKRKERLLNLVETVVDRYKNNPAVKYWQVENEPFLEFGICPPLDVAVLDKEIALIREKDPTRKIIVTDSGELSMWYQAAKRADIFGTTMYFNVCSSRFGCFTYPIGSNFFRLKRWVIRTFAHQENAFVVELAGEPWLNEWTVNATLEKQLNSMNGEKLAKNLAFAQKAGFSKIYIWGVEWWYWLKTKKNYPDVWNSARELFMKND